MEKFRVVDRLLKAILENSLPVGLLVLESYCYRKRVMSVVRPYLLWPYSNFYRDFTRLKNQGSDVYVMKCGK